MGKKKNLFIGIGFVLILCIAIVFIIKSKHDEYYVVKFVDISQNYEKEINIKKGETVESIVIFNDGYEFLGWYLNGNKYNFNQPITNNITLEAKWKKIEIKNEDNKEKTVEEDAKTNSLEDEKGTTSSNTSNNDSSNKNNNNNTTSSNNKSNNSNNQTNTSATTSKKYTVYFNSDGGSFVSNQIINENGVVSRPSSPTKDGYVFENWYLGNNVYNFNNKVNQNITLVAHWTIAKISVTSISLDKTSNSMNINDTILLNASILPSNATNKSISWNSSNPSVATVSNGTVRALGVGNATITATVDGKTASCNITVVKPITYSYEIKDASGSTTGQVYIFIKSSEGVYVNGTLTITYTNGGSETVNVSSNGYLFPNRSVISSISNVKGNS